jgi:hypothetical protein
MCGHRRLRLLAAPAPGPSLQRHRLPLLLAPPPGIGGGAGVGGSGERGGRRASDIDGVDGPAATQAPGPSPQVHRLPLLAVPPQGIGGCGGVSYIYRDKQKAMPDI